MFGNWPERKGRELATGDDSVRLIFTPQNKGHYSPLPLFGCRRRSSACLQDMRSARAVSPAKFRHAFELQFKLSERTRTISIVLNNCGMVSGTFERRLVLFKAWFLVTCHRQRPHSNELKRYTPSPDKSADQLLMQDVHFQAGRRHRGTLP